MTADKRDNALSEVIGMLLILAIIVVAMSVYVTYMVPEKGKVAEIRHMNDVRGSFLDLSYLIDSLWVNNQVHVPVTVPISLRTALEPSAIPLFVPISSSGVLSLTNESDSDGYFTVTFNGFNEQRVFINPPPPDVIAHGVPKDLTREPYKVLLNFTPLVLPSNPKQGNIAEVNGTTSGIDFLVHLEVRSFVKSANATALYLGDVANAIEYKHSLVAVDRISGLEYMVVDDLLKSSPGVPTVEVDIKPVLDLFPGAKLVKGSKLQFNLVGGLPSPSECTPHDPYRLACHMNLTFSYGLQYGVPPDGDIPPSRIDPVSVTNTTPLSDLTFTAQNYYWVDQKFQYQKGAVFLLQDYIEHDFINLGLTNSTPLSDAQIRVTNTTEIDDPVTYITVSVVDINLQQKPNSRTMSSSGGSAQIVAEISNLEHRLEDKNTNLWYLVSDGTAHEAIFQVTSENESTLRTWFNMFERVCVTEGACEIRVCRPADPGCTVPGYAPTYGQVTLRVFPGIERILVQYIKVDLDMEIRP